MQKLMVGINKINHRLLYEPIYGFRAQAYGWALKASLGVMYLALDFSAMFQKESLLSVWLEPLNILASCSDSVDQSSRIPMFDKKILPASVIVTYMNIVFSTESFIFVQSHLQFYQT